MFKKLTYYGIVLCLLLSACKPGQMLSSGLHECPDAWIINNMPGPNHSLNRKEYLIYKGERHELKEFDMEWVKKHCKIEPEYVQ